MGYTMLYEKVKNFQPQLYGQRKTSNETVVTRKFALVHW